MASVPSDKMSGLLIIIHTSTLGPVTIHKLSGDTDRQDSENSPPTCATMRPAVLGDYLRPSLSGGDKTESLWLVEIVMFWDERQCVRCMLPRRASNASRVWAVSIVRFTQPMKIRNVGQGGGGSRKGGLKATYPVNVRDAPMVRIAWMAKLSCCAFSVFSHDNPMTIP
ncbi:hypothetical protein CGRA01v4_08395 [Colletotrichum graminicola]|nr:hypothetical protein CGRA01v4_08395 [Colletotrichum graminicola]